MQTFVISDDDPIAHRARQVLLRGGLDCPPSNVIALDLAVVHLVHEHPELVLFVLPPAPERALALLPDLRARTKARLLVIGPTTDAKLVLRALRSGADDYVDVEELDGELQAVLARWREERAQHEQIGRLIAVLAPSGGSGSSTVAVNVAAVLAKEHKASVLMDLKLQAGDTAALMDLKPSYTLADLCQNVDRMDAVLFERTLARHASGVRLLAAPLTLADVALIHAEGTRRAVGLARDAFPYVVADLDHSFRDEQVAVLLQADVVLLVLRLEFAALRNIKRTLDHLKELGIDPGRIRLVVNRYGQPKEVTPAKAEEALGLKIAHFVPEDAKSVIRASNNGVPVVLEAPSAKVSRSLAQLAVSVNGRHKPS